MKRWEPAIELSKKEQFIIKRLKRTRKLFAFLRLHRHELFDDKFQQELEGMYRDSGAGEEPVPPALLCMALLLQGYHRISDAEAVELTVMDLRWQMVLGCLGADEPASRIFAWRSIPALLKGPGGSKIPSTCSATLRARSLRLLPSSPTPRARRSAGRQEFRCSCHRASRPGSISIGMTPSRKTRRSNGWPVSWPG